MDIQNIYNAGLILSNNYTELCKPYNIIGNKESKVIDLELAIAISSKLCLNTPEGVTNNITLYGVNDNNVWRDIVVNLIQIINEFNNCQIRIQTENNFLNEFQLKFCQENNVALINIINKAEDLTYIKNILAYKPLTKICYSINSETLPVLYDNYLFLEEANCQSYEIDLNKFEQWTEADLNILYEQLNKIKQHMLQKFEADELPLVPEDFKKMFNKILIKDFNVKNNVSVFNYFEQLNKQCGFTSCSNYFIDQDGKLYTCCITDLSENSPLYCGFYDKDTVTFVQAVDEFDIFSNIYTDIFGISPKSETKSCEDCSIQDICMGDCYAINLVLQSSGNISSKNYCMYTTYIYDLLFDLTLTLDRAKNELFRDFLFGCSLKGYFNYDR